MNNRPAELLKGIIRNAANSYELKGEKLAEVKMAIAAIKTLRIKKQEEVAALRDMKSDCLQPAIESLVKEYSELDLNQLNIHRSPLLLVAAEHGHIELINLLKAEGMDFDGRDLANACKKNKSDMATTLIECKADVNTPDADGITALMHSSSNGQTNMVRKLVNAGADLNMTYQRVDDKNHSALDIAVGANYADIVVHLLSFGALIRHPDKLFLFIQSCKPDFTRLNTFIAYRDQQKFLHEHKDIEPGIERRAEDELNAVQVSMEKVLVDTYKQPNLLNPGKEPFNASVDMLLPLLPTFPKELLPLIVQYAYCPGPQYPNDWMRIFCRGKVNESKAELAADAVNGQTPYSTQARTS